MQRGRGVFDQLRLALTLGVLYTHSIRFLDGDNHREFSTVVFGIQSKMGFGVGDLCVDGFFAVSGFLIAGAWNRNPRLWPFMLNRILRVYPGFVIASLACLFFFPAFAVPDFAAYLGQLHPGKILRELATLNGPSALVYLGTHHPVANGSTWTIPLEARCYAIAAGIGLLAKNWHRQMAGWSVFYLALLVGICLDVHPPQTALVNLFSPWPEFFVRFAACFAGGALIQLNERWFDRHSIWLVTSAFAAFVACMFYEPILPLAIPLFVPLLVVGIGRSGWLARQIPSWKMDLSYGTFLYGWPVQKLLVQYLPESGVIGHLAMAIPLVLACAWCSWTFVEAPMLRLKRRKPGFAVN
jgi:peptidoglycan/LPS O-acetylase OafA/YrhL